MIYALPKSLIEAATTHAIFSRPDTQFKYQAFMHFNCDSDIMCIMESIDLVTESLDSKMVLHDVTAEAKKQMPPALNSENGVTHFKVEYSVDTDEAITTYKRDGAWEIHHQRGNINGEKIGGKSPAMKFVSHMHAFVKEKTNNGEKVRISAPKELIGSYHKLATHFSNKIGNISMTDIHPGHDINRLGVPVHEFTIYPSNLHESVSPFFMKFEHLRMQFVKEQFGLTDAVVQYEEKLRNQGHQID